MVTRNPFTPTFGIVPPFLAGRDVLLSVMSRAFRSGLGDPNLCSILIGPRGSGKTALLSCVGDEARKCGWIVVNTVAEDGMLEDIFQHASAEAAQIIEPAAKRRLTGLTIADVIGVEWERAETEAPNWRMRMETLLAKLSEQDVGLLITVDEARVEVEELVRLVSSYQLFIRAGYTVALVMAGLPANVTDLVGDIRVSFLRRARQHYLEIINDADVARALRKTVEQSGGTITEEALNTATSASGGFPYMIQLVGYNMWAESEDGKILPEHAERGAKDAEEDFRRGVLERTWQEMSKGDRAFALAMLPDKDGSTISSVASRLKRGTNYASTYKKRLMRQGLISERPGGTFDFDIPQMRKYLLAMK